MGKKEKLSQTPRSPTDQEIKKLERLIQLTVRAFFQPIDIVVIDELVRRRSKVTDKALAKLLKLGGKEVQSSLYRMEKNWMVTLEMRNEKNQVVSSSQGGESGSSGPYRHHRKVRNRSVVHALWVKTIFSFFFFLLSFFCFFCFFCFFFFSLLVICE